VTDRVRTSLLLLLLALPARGAAQEPLDTAAMRRIRDEGFSRSRVLETALGLSDLQPPRLAGSPGFLAAADYATGRLKDWGIARAALEPWGRRSPSWVLDRYSVEMVSPWYLHLTAFPRAWSASTVAPVTAPVVVVSIQSDSDFAEYHGKLRGKIVLNGTIEPPAAPDGPMVERFSDAALDSLSRLTDPGLPATPTEDMRPWRELIAYGRRFSAFLAREGAVALLEPSEIEASLRVDGWFAYPAAAWGGVPSLVLSRAHFNRVLRLVDAGKPVKISVALRGHRVAGDSLGSNVVAEIPGSDPALRDQVVMLGGHLDSWIAGTGAADNGAGCAIGMEVLRILTAAELHPRRTIRLALWDAEEPSEDYAGSMGYVRRHFGDPSTGQLHAEQAGLSAYFNLDNGSGRIRGIYLQGNAAARPVFESLLAPFADLGADHVTIANTGETDHIPFWALGLPAFQFIQDPLDYDARVHHSDLDVGDYLREADLEQAAVVMASVVYHVAMRDALIPRTPH
jgi:hypothetical protein